MLGISLQGNQINGMWTGRGQSQPTGCECRYCPKACLVLWLKHYVGARYRENCDQSRQSCAWSSSTWTVPIASLSFLQRRST